MILYNMKNLYIYLTTTSVRDKSDLELTKHTQTLSWRTT